MQSIQVQLSIARKSIMHWTHCDGTLNRYNENKGVYPWLTDRAFAAMKLITQRYQTTVRSNATHQLQEVLMFVSLITITPADNRNACNWLHAQQTNTVVGHGRRTAVGDAATALAPRTRLQLGLHTAR